MTIEIHSDRLVVNGTVVDPRMAVAIHPWLEKYIKHLLNR